MLKSLHPMPETYDTDKGRSKFTYIYEQLFCDSKEDVEKILEIGVNRGGSLELWRDYFQNATVYGIDINHKALRAISERIKVSMVNQSNKAELEEFARGKHFNIIIDDGSHVVSHQILSFETLWPHVSNGGYYIIEDVITCYWINSKYGYVDQELTTIDYFKDVIDELNHHGKKERDKTMRYVNFYPNLIVIKKKS